MDSKTFRKLQDINRRVAEKYRNSMTVTEKTWAFEKDIVHELMPKASLKEQEMMKRAINDPIMQKKFEQTKTTMNPETTRKMAAEVEYKVQKAVRDGEIPPAKEDKQHEQFMRKMFGK